MQVFSRVACGVCACVGLSVAGGCSSTTEQREDVLGTVTAGASSVAGAGAAATRAAGRSAAAGAAAVGGKAGAASGSAGATGSAGARAGSAGTSAGSAGTSASGAAGASSGGAAGASGAAGPSGVAGTSRAAGASGAGAAAQGGSAGITAAGSGGTQACTPPAMGTRGKNPLFTDTYTADPGVLVHNCTFYIQSGHDQGDTGFVLREWYLLKSTDMVTWTKEIALDLSVFSWADVNAWAGQMVVKDGKFYWYVPVNERGGGMTIAVAVADSPVGPFKDAIGKPLINDDFEMSNAGFRTPSDTPFTIDPTVFIDDDGAAYLHYGGFGRMMVAKLGSDMVSIDGKLQEVTPRGFFEAPFLFKREGKYYEVYAAGQNPAAIDYATSDSPLGPWEYGGRILDPLPNVPGQDAATSHPGVGELAGQWYLVYHLSDGPNNGGTYRRQVAVDKLFFNDDGSIEPVERSDGLSF
jgi:hypothetical protein